MVVIQNEAQARQRAARAISMVSASRRVGFPLAHVRPNSRNRNVKVIQPRNQTTNHLGFILSFGSWYIFFHPFFDGLTGQLFGVALLILPILISAIRHSQKLAGRNLRQVELFSPLSQELGKGELDWVAHFENSFLAYKQIAIGRDAATNCYQINQPASTV